MSSLKNYFVVKNTSDASGESSSQTNELVPTENQQNIADETRAEVIGSIDFTDAAKWGLLQDKDTVIEDLKDNDVTKIDFSKSKVNYKNQNRFATSLIFYRVFLD